MFSLIKFFRSEQAVRGMIVPAAIFLLFNYRTITQAGASIIGLFYLKRVL